MPEDQMMEIIKGAIILEHKGKVLFENAANQAAGDEVRGIFKTMAEEEEKHIEILNEHYKNLQQNGKLAEIQYPEKPKHISTNILTENIKQEINAAGYEAAAISAAMAMEERAIKYYSARADATNDPLEKELFTWLSDWEQTHLNLLVDIDKELQESIWYDNNFWPVL